MPDRYGDRDDKPNPLAALFPDDTTTEYEQGASRQADRILAGQAITACQLCDDDGYRGATVCDHVDHYADTAAGRAAVTAALAKIRNRHRGATA